MSDRPEPERTVIVEEAHLLHDQIEFSEEQYEDADNPVAEAYHQERVKQTQELAQKIEDKGLRESELREMKADAEELAKSFDEENPEKARAVADLESVEQTLEEYFGDSSGPVELGEVISASVFEDETVQLNGTNNSVQLTTGDKGNTRATADAVLGGAGMSIDDLGREARPL